MGVSVGQHAGVVVSVIIGKEMMPSLTSLMLTRMFRVMEQPTDIGGHLPTLYALARNSGGRMVELGVRQGNSTLALWAGAVECNGILTSYDIVSSCRGSALKTAGLPDNSSLLKHWRFICKGSLAAAKDWKNGSVTLLFIDTTHSYDDTLKELLAWGPKVTPRGVICGHDYNDALRRKTFGVDRAVAEYQRRTKEARRLYFLRHTQGLFILWPR